MPLGAHIDKAVKEAILSIPVCPCPQAGGPACGQTGLWVIEAW